MKKIINFIICGVTFFTPIWETLFVEDKCARNIIVVLGLLVCIYSCVTLISIERKEEQNGRKQKRNHQSKAARF